MAFPYKSILYCPMPLYLKHTSRSVQPGKQLLTELSPVSRSSDAHAINELQGFNKPQRHPNAEDAKPYP
jgi:hypothetical protein